MRTYFVYIITSKKNGTLYIGVTNDLARRVDEHKSKIADGFTSRYDVNKLVYYEEYEYVFDAIDREKQLKNWHRKWKINLIEENNPHWQDLSAEWVDSEINSE